MEAKDEKAAAPEHKEEEFPPVAEPWGHPGQPTVGEVPEALEARRRNATRRQQKMTEDKTGEGVD